MNSHFDRCRRVAVFLLRAPPDRSEWRFSELGQRNPWIGYAKCCALRGWLAVLSYGRIKLIAELTAKCMCIPIGVIGSLWGVSLYIRLRV
jgi:hypothetical protein